MITKLFWPKGLKIKTDQVYKVHGWQLSKTEVVCSRIGVSDKDSSIGICSSNSKALELLDSHLKIEIDDGVPTIVFIDGSVVSVWIIYFTIPKSLQYYSTLPLNLGFDIDARELENKDEADLEMSRRTEAMKSNIKCHANDGRSIRKPCADLEGCLKKVQMTTNRQINSITRPEVNSKVSSPFYIRILLFISLLLQAILRKISFLLNSNIVGLRVSLCRISCTAQQLELRIQQIMFWPSQYIEWLQCDNKLSPYAQAQYIGFFNTFWLIANDIIIGTALRSLLYEYKDSLANFLNSAINDYGLEFIDKMLIWLMGWPAGLKLNSELGSFLGELFRWMIFAWKELLAISYPYFPVVIICCSNISVLGATFALSMISDIVSFSTLHLQLFYVISARIYYWALKIIASTFNIFRGKKWNPLRKRIDAAIYDLDQLLLGAVIFALLVFLLPTVAVYYILFSLSIGTVVLLQSLLEIFLAVLNHFPLFAIMLRIKDPKRLSDGVSFKVAKRGAIFSNGVPKSPHPSVIYLELQNEPIGLNKIFYQYGYLLKRISAFYLTSSTMGSFLRGVRVSFIPKLVYPTIPSRPK